MLLYKEEYQNEAAAFTGNKHQGKRKMLLPHVLGHYPETTLWPIDFKATLQEQLINNAVAVCLSEGSEGSGLTAACCSIIEEI